MPKLPLLRIGIRTRLPDPVLQEVLSVLDKILAIIAAAEVVSLRLAVLALLLFGLWEFLRFMFGL